MYSNLASQRFIYILIGTDYTAFWCFKYLISKPFDDAYLRAYLNALSNGFVISSGERIRKNPQQKFHSEAIRENYIR